MVVLDSHTIRLEKERGGRLVQPVHLTGENTGLERQQSEFLGETGLETAIPGSQISALSTPVCSHPWRLLTPASPTISCRPDRCNVSEELGRGSAWIKGQCLHPGTPSFGSLVMLQGAGSY